MSKIRADCFAVIVATGKLVYVERPAPFSGVEGEWLDYDPTVWKTTGGEYSTAQLKPLNVSEMRYIFLALLERGIGFYREEGIWSIR